MPDLLALLQQFATSLTQNFASTVPGQEEDQLKPAVKILLETAAPLFSKTALLRSESTVQGLGGRPDFGVDVGGLLCGYIELKKPGEGARPQTFAARTRNAEQWKKFATLPNLLYTDGNEWSLFHTGQQVGQTVRLAGNIIRDGANAATQTNADALEGLLRDFLWWEPIVPARPADLARLLAPLCKLIRTDVQNAVTNANSSLTLLAAEWRAALFPDADDARFADAYAQTLTYALLLARVEGQTDLTVDNAAHALVENHGLLAEALSVLGHPSARAEIGTGLSVLLRLLNALDPSVWNRADPSSAGDDPWLYFYEDFLAAYDPKLRADAGVYYTPVPVIQLQVRLIDEILRSPRFNKRRGFNDENVTILDPAAGTGAYPLAVLEHALHAAEARTGAGAVEGAASNLAARLNAFEFLVGPYAVAHLRLTQAVRAKNGHLPPEGAKVYLCDTLESPFEAVQRAFFTQRLATEHERARAVKAQQPILVCLGNPPYDRQQRTDDTETLRGGWIRWGTGTPGNPQNAPLEDFLGPARRAGHGIHLKNLYNDYVYFWRWALWKTFENAADAVRENAGGIVCFITASSYLRGPGFAGMRQVMRETFDELWILDLEGDGRGARPTENVFNIQTGVAIALGVRKSGVRNTPQMPAAQVKYAKITGTRQQKFDALNAIGSLGDVEWRNCPTGLQEAFLPASEAAYYDWPELTDLFPWQQSGSKFQRTWPIGTTNEVLRQRWQRLVSSNAQERPTLFKESRDRKVDLSYFDARSNQRLPAIQTLDNDASPNIVRYGFRAFDRRWAISDSRVGDFLAPPLWNSYSNQQVFLTSLLTGILGDGPAAVVSGYVPDLHHFRGSFGGKDTMPLWRDAAATEANITGGLLARIGEIWNTDPPPPQNLFAYCYALLTPRAYVQTFAEELLIPGPHIPLTRNPALFAQVAAIGHDLVRLHTFGERSLQNDVPAPGEVTPGAARCTHAVPSDPAHYPEDFRYDPTNQILRVGDGQFAPVSPDVWEYRVSGLQVVSSWLAYRKRDPAGKKSSPLDEIRPQAWTAALTEELLEVLWTLEETLAKEPQTAALLQTVLESPLINASDLPQPTPAERAAPLTGGTQPDQTPLEI